MFSHEIFELLIFISWLLKVLEFFEILVLTDSATGKIYYVLPT